MKCLFLILALLYCSAVNAETWVATPEGVTKESRAVAEAFERSEVTRAERIAWWIAVGASALDIYTTRRGLKGGCVETNPVLGGSPSVGALVLKDGAILTGLWFANRNFKHGEIFSGGVAFAHLAAAYSNSRKQCYRRGG